jgi:hypothetical protein
MANQGGGPQQRRDTAVGAVLVGVALLIGVVLLVKGYSADGGLVATSKPAVTSSTTTQAPTTTLPARPVADIAVAVYNATGGGMVASKNRSVLESKGFQQITIGDAPSVVPETQIFFTSGARSDAQQVAVALGKDPQLVQALPSPPPAPIGSATVLVLAGPDLA